MMNSHDAADDIGTPGGAALRQEPVPGAPTANTGTNIGRLADQALVTYERCPVSLMQSRPDPALGLERLRRQSRANGEMSVV